MAPRVSEWVITIVAGGLILQPAFSQGRGGATAAPPTTSGSSGSTGTTTGTTGIGNKLPTTTNPTTTPNTTTTMPQPIYVSGRVMMEDGNPPDQPVTIERVCSGTPRAEGYTDSKGYFGFQLGQRNGVLQDASESNGSGGIFGDSPTGSNARLGGLGSGSQTAGMGSDMRLMGCDLQAKLGGYRSQSISLTNRRALDNPDVGVILLHRIGPSEGTTVSATSLAAPKDARKAFEKGQDAIKKKKWEEAAKSFQKAVDIYPDYATAWYELGRLQAAGGAPDTARISLECALKADPKFAAPYVELASLEVDAKKWKEVASFSDKGIRLDSFDYPELFFYNAAANYYLRNQDAAEKSVRQAIKLDNNHRFPQASYLFGLILTQRRDYASAAEQFRDFLKLAPDAQDAPAAKQKLEQIAQITAKGGVPPEAKLDEIKQDK